MDDANLSLYGSYSESFFVPVGNAYLGNNPGGVLEPFNPANYGALTPETSQAVDFGIKAELTDKLNLLVGGFWIERQNITQAYATGDLTFDFLFSQQIGAARSQGIEVELTGELAENWLLISGYGYVDSEITDDNDPASIGSSLAEVPDHTFNLFTRYNFINNCTTTIGAGFGCYYIGDRAIGTPVQIEIPDYARLDAGLYVTRGNVDATFYLENLADRRYILGGGSIDRLMPGAPITFRAALQARF